MHLEEVKANILCFYIAHILVSQLAGAFYRPLRNPVKFYFPRQASLLCLLLILLYMLSWTIPPTLVVLNATCLLKISNTPLPEYSTNASNSMCSKWNSLSLPPNCCIVYIS